MDGWLTKQKTANLERAVFRQKYWASFSQDRAFLSSPVQYQRGQVLGCFDYMLEIINETIHMYYRSMVCIVALYLGRLLTHNVVHSTMYYMISPCIVSTSSNQRADTTLQTRDNTQKVVPKYPVPSCNGKGYCLLRRAQ